MTSLTIANAEPSVMDFLVVVVVVVFSAAAQSSTYGCSDDVVVERYVLLHFPRQPAFAALTVLTHSNIESLREFRAAANIVQHGGRRGRVGMLYVPSH